MPSCRDPGVLGVMTVPSSRELLAADSRGGQQALDAPQAQAVLSGERRGGRAGAVGVDHLGEGAVVESVSQAPWSLGRRCSEGNDDGAAVVGASLQVSELCGVRVSGKYLHLQRHGDSDLFATYADSFERVWTTAKPLTAPA